MPEVGGSKICVVCGEDCASKPRTKDAKGRYFCKSCYGNALSKLQAPRPQSQMQSSSTTATKPPVAKSPPVRSRAQDADDRGAYDIETFAVKSASRTSVPAHAAPLPELKALPSMTCPSCEAALPPGTLVCVPCGINVTTGRSILTAEQGDTERTYEHARGILWFASWIMWMGLLPISSEAHGTRKPRALQFIAIITVLFSMWMWWFEWTDSPQMRVLKNQFHWVGNATPDAEHIEAFYQITSYGDYRAFERKKDELADTVPSAELPLAALNALPPSKRCFGEFHVWQLLTSAFLHGGFLHLAGNMLFLLIFGSRINALIGNVGTLILYPLLAIVSALADMVAMANEMPAPCLGASGAIMGLAGMYLVLFPVSPVHVAIFIRLPILLLHLFKCRGFWILLYFIAWDVLATVLQWQDGTAHWAHLGGFMAGMAVAFVLLITKAVNARGSDLISVIFGRRAWNLLGKPSQWVRMPECEGWLTRLRLIPESVREGISSVLRPG